MKSEDANASPSAPPANLVRYPLNNNNSNGGNNNNRGRNGNRGNKGKNSGRDGRGNNGGGGSGDGCGQYPQWWQQQFPWQQQYPWAPPPCPYRSYWAKPNVGSKQQQSGILGPKSQPAAFTATGPSPTHI